MTDEERKEHRKEILRYLNLSASGVCQDAAIEIEWLEKKLEIANFDIQIFENMCDTYGRLVDSLIKERDGWKERINRLMEVS